MDSYSNDVAQRICKEAEEAINKRAMFDSQWEEIARRIVVDDSNLFRKPTPENTWGDKRTSELFDPTGTIALGRFSSILDSIITPRNQTYQRLVPSLDELKKDKETMLWFEQTTKILFKERYKPEANFSGQNQLVWHSLGAYGTSGMFTDEYYGRPGLRYKNIHVSELLLFENHQGVVDKVIRPFLFTARQAQQKWGDAISDRMKEKAKNQPNSEHVFYHCVEERKSYDPERRDAKGMPWAGYYVEEMGKHLIKEEGFTSFPYTIPRYRQHGKEPYGRSPAMEVLPSLKTLNEQKKTVLVQGHRAVNPIFLAHDDGVMDTFSAMPGAVNMGGVSADGRPLVHALPVGNINIGKDLMDDERATINGAFLVDLFQLLIEGPQKTATEVVELAKEKGILLAPTLGRQQSEYLGPLTLRELDVLSKQGKLPPQPGLLREAQGEYEILYESPLSRVQRAEEAAGLMRTLETALSAVNVTQDPTPLDHFNWDKIIPEIGEIQGVPRSWMRSDKEIAAMREQRAQSQANQDVIQAAPAMAAMAKVAKG